MRNDDKMTSKQVPLPWKHQTMETIAKIYLKNSSTKLHETFSIYL